MVEELRQRGLLARVLVAFGLVYFVWGSTFLAIRIAIADIPPVFMCAVRLLLAGAILLAWARATGTAWPDRARLRNAALVGVLLPGIGNASVTLGETHVPSGLVALLVATIPAWMAVLAALGPDRVRPGPQALAGLVLGFAGIALLLGPGMFDARRAEFSPLWALIPIAGSVSWAWGSLWSRRVPQPGSPVMGTGIGLAAGGVMLLAISLLSGDAARFAPARVTPVALAALAYLVVFGSVIAFTAYLYLLRKVPPSMVATYAFVNPMVAMTLGAVFAHERISPRTLLASGVVLAGVVLIITMRAAAPAGAGAAGAAAVARRP